MATLTLIRLARASALDSLSNRIDTFKNPHVVVSFINQDVPKEQIPKLLDRTYPPKYLADQLGIATTSTAQELFGGDNLRAQLWQALVYLQAKIDIKGKLLEAILDGEKNRVYPPASNMINMISNQKLLIPDFVREELNLVF